MKNQDFISGYRKARIKAGLERLEREAERNRLIRAAIVETVLFVFAGIPYVYLYFTQSTFYGFVFVPMLLLGLITNRSIEKGGREHGGIV